MKALVVCESMFGDTAELARAIAAALAETATFDTRVTKVRRLPGSAARSAVKAGRKHGFATCAVPQSFYVEDIKGPLVEGEAEHATAWGRKLSALVQAQ